MRSGSPKRPRRARLHRPAAPAAGCSSGPAASEAVCITTSSSRSAEEAGTPASGGRPRSWRGRGCRRSGPRALGAGNHLVQVLAALGLRNVGALGQAPQAEQAVERVRISWLVLAGRRSWRGWRPGRRPWPGRGPARCGGALSSSMIQEGAAAAGVVGVQRAGHQAGQEGGAIAAAHLELSVHQLAGLELGADDGGGEPSRRRGWARRRWRAGQ